MEIFYEQMEFVSTEIYEDVWTFIQDIPRQDNLGQCQFDYEEIVNCDLNIGWIEK